MNGTVNDIIAKYDETIEKTISLYKVRARQYGLDQDDFRQICRITIWNCLKTKKESEEGFIPYIKTAMRKAIRSYIIRNTTGKSQQAIDKTNKGKYLTTSELLFKPCDDPETLWKEATDSLSGIHGSVDEFITACENKDPVLKNIIDLRLKGHDGHHIAKLEKMSYPTYKRRLKTIKEMYCAYFEENENDIEKQRSGKARPATPH